MTPASECANGMKCFAYTLIREKKQCQRPDDASKHAQEPDESATPETRQLQAQAETLALLKVSGNPINGWEKQSRAGLRRSFGIPPTGIPMASCKSLREEFSRLAPVHRRHFQAA